MKPQVIRVKSWSKLYDALYHDSWAEDLHRYRSSYVYRGLADRSYDLSTTLNRLGESHLERHLLRIFPALGFAAQSLVLARIRAAPRAADSPARLDLFTNCGAALRNFRFHQI
jgi:hypothetical protein